MQRHPDNMNKVELYLSLGSNQGDREQNIETALSLLNIELGKPYKRVSSMIETEPWGFDSEDKFINAAVLYELDLPEGYNAEAEALMILEICKDLSPVRRIKQGSQSADGNTGTAGDGHTVQHFRQTPAQADQPQQTGCQEAA